jgi:hypothetical protein
MVRERRVEGHLVHGGLGTLVEVDVLPAEGDTWKWSVACSVRRRGLTWKLSATTARSGTGYCNR